MADINFFAIATAAVVSLAVATIWYSPLLFGTAWMHGASLRQDDRDAEVGTVWVRLFAGFVVQFSALLLTTSLLALSSIARVESPIVALSKIAVLVALVSASLVIWERRPLSYFLIHGAYLLMAMVGGGAIIMYWPW